MKNLTQQKRFLSRTARLVTLKLSKVKGSGKIRVPSMTANEVEQLETLYDNQVNLEYSHGYLTVDSAVKGFQPSPVSAPSSTPVYNDPYMIWMMSQIK